MGVVEQEEVLKEEQAIREYKYSPHTSLVAILNKTEDLRDFATAAHNPYTEIQPLNIGLQILKELETFTEE